MTTYDKTVIGDLIDGVIGDRISAGGESDIDRVVLVQARAGGGVDTGRTHLQGHDQSGGQHQRSPGCGCPAWIACTVGRRHPTDRSERASGQADEP